MTGHIGMGLTPGQAKVLAVIKRWHIWRGLSPTVREIMAEASLRSTAQVAKALHGLEERGVIRRHPGYMRVIELVDPPARFHFIPVSALTWPEVA